MEWVQAYLQPERKRRNEYKLLSRRGHTVASLDAVEPNTGVSPGDYVDEPGLVTLRLYKVLTQIQKLSGQLNPHEVALLDVEQCFPGHGNTEQKAAALAEMTGEPITADAYKQRKSRLFKKIRQDNPYKRTLAPQPPNEPEL